MIRGGADQHIVDGEGRISATPNQIEEARQEAEADGIDIVRS